MVWIKINGFVHAAKAFYGIKVYITINNDYVILFIKV